MQGLSFREYLSLTTGQDFPVFSLEQIIKENERISAELAALVGVARQTVQAGEGAWFAGETR